MTGDCHCQRVGAAGLGNHAYRLWRADEFCDVRVARRRAHGNFSQRLPNALLEGRSADIEGKIEAECRRFDKPDHFRDEPLKTGVTADEIGLRELVLQIARKRVRVVPEKNGADTAIALSHENRAKRTFTHGEMDFRLRSTGTIV